MVIWNQKNNLICQHFTERMNLEPPWVCLKFICLNISNADCWIDKSIWTTRERRLQFWKEMSYHVYMDNCFTSFCSLLILVNTISMLLKLWTRKKWLRATLLRTNTLRTKQEVTQSKSHPQRSLPKKLQLFDGMIIVLST